MNILFINCYAIINIFDNRIVMDDRRRGYSNIAESFFWRIMIDDRIDEKNYELYNENKYKVSKLTHNEKSLLIEYIFNTEKLEGTMSFICYENDEKMITKNDVRISKNQKINIFDNGLQACFRITRFDDKHYIDAPFINDDDYLWFVNVEKSLIINVYHFDKKYDDGHQSSLWINFDTKQIYLINPNGSNSRIDSEFHGNKMLIKAIKIWMNLTDFRNFNFNEPNYPAVNYDLKDIIDFSIRTEEQQKNLTIYKEFTSTGNCVTYSLLISKLVSYGICESPYEACIMINNFNAFDRIDILAAYNNYLLNLLKYINENV